MKPLSHIAALIRQAATGPLRLPAPLSWRMLTRDRAAAVQRAILREYLKTGSTASRLLTLGIALLFWPWRTFAQAWKLTRRVGGQFSHVRSKPVQFFQQVKLAWFHGISPYLYYLQNMAASQSPLRPMEWLQNGHAGLLSRVFREEKTLPEINDKVLFAQVMEAHGVPTPPTIAVFSGGRLLAGFTESEFVRASASYQGLFVKPVRSSGGKNSMLLERQADGRWLCQNSSTVVDGFRAVRHDPHRSVLNQSELIAKLAAESVAGAVIVQPLLANHPDLPSFGGLGLITLRLLTGLGEKEVVVLRAVLSLPFRDSITSQQGRIVAVDHETGCLGCLFSTKTLDQRFARTLGVEGPVIEGLSLPFWPEVVDVIRQAHLALPSYTFVGWDVAVTRDGPMVLEANGNYATVALQKPGPQPLIDEQFLSVFDYWARKQRNYRYSPLPEA